MRATLTVRPPEGEPFEIEIGNTATIGRSRENTLCLTASPHVSRQHAIIRCQNACQFQIMDLGSRNGTFLNGRRVITPVTLGDGAVIRIASYEITFSQVDAPAESEGFEVTMAAGTDVTGEESATVAVMVCDLRGFSTMSEQLPEEILARTLGEWFRDAGDIIHGTGGIIDKFIGDAVLAYWIRENDSGEESAQALSSGLRLLERSARRHWPTETPRPFRIAVALHHGLVTCGNIGLVAQRDATIIGDTVNTVFRIESVMKSLGQKIAASQDFVKTLTAQTIAFNDLGEHQLKGKNQHVRLYGIGA